MSLAIGAFLGPYRVLAHIGSGGMGEVYQAHDGRLNRTVALKILPAAAVSDAERRRRLIEEARAASALDHPNIITIYDVIEAEGAHVIVMQYVSGKTLRELVGKMKLSEALGYAVQMADALAAAHKHGIVHRDLKPENVMVTEDGRVKILDFGLAKLLLPAGWEEVSSQDDVRTLTREGQIVGTAAYMSPEQAEGKEVDARSDLFSFGSILYEMVTGKKAFAGASVPALLAAIVRDEPTPVGELVPAVSIELQAILSRALRKDRERRFQSMSELEVALQDVQTEIDSGRVLAAGRWNSTTRGVRIAAALVVAGAAAATLYLYRSGSDSGPPPRVVPLTSYPGREQDPALSPDGSLLAFLWDGGDERTPPQLYVQLVGGGDPVQLTRGPEPVFRPAWSPDGKEIAFLRHVQDGENLVDGIFAVPALGGPERRLASSSSDGHGLSWSPDGQVLAILDKESPGDRDAIYLLSLMTGDRRQLTSPPSDFNDGRPAFSPDGTEVAFTRQVEGAANADIYLQSVAGGEPRRLTFDGLPVLDLDFLPDGSAILFTSPSNFREGTNRLWRVRADGGKAMPLLMGEDSQGLSLTRSAPRLAYSTRIEDTNVWRVSGPASLERRTPHRWIASTRTDNEPEFSPDGAHVAFSSDRSGPWATWICDQDGKNCRRLTFERSPLNLSWSPDGKRVAFAAVGPEGNWDIYIAGVEGSFSRRLTEDPAPDGTPTWSRDGCFLYFGSFRDGEWQLWKMPSDGGTPHLVLRQAVIAFESEDGRFLYYLRTSSSLITGPIWRAPVDGSDEGRLVLDEPIFFSGFRLWRGNLVYLVKNLEDGPSIRMMDLATGDITHLAELGPDSRPFFGLTVSPDGLSILYAEDESKGGDIMLVENPR